MITHRMETRPMPEPPVKLYKTIALSFLIITIILLGVVIFTTTKKATITVMAKEDTKNVNLVVNVERQRQSTKAVTGTVSSTPFDFSQTYYPTNAKIIDGVAEGEVIIYNKSNTEQPLVKTTRLLTPNNVLFRIKNNVTVPANGQITASVYADTIGKQNEIGPSQFIIPGLKPERQKMVYAESIKPMVGGSHEIKVLTEDDLQAAEKDFKEKTKEAFLKNLTANNDNWYNQKIATVTDQKITNSAKVGDEVSEFKLSSKNNIVYLMYNQEELADIVSKELTNKIDMTAEKVLSSSKEPQVSLMSYDLAQGTAQLSITQDITVTLDANSEKLATQNFTGKSKDEIERYVLGLPHAAGVEIKISPQWSRSAPSVPDKIKVIVKSIQ